MSKFQQLIMKALSTESDHEALACLAKAKREKPEFSTTQVEARVQGKTALEWREVAFQQHANTKFKSKTAREWHDVAEYYYERNERLKQQVESLTQQMSRNEDTVKTYRVQMILVGFVSSIFTTIVWLTFLL